MRSSILLLLAFILLSVSCTAEPEQPSAENIDLALAAQYFDEFDELCTADSAELWGVSLCGPFLLVDPATRAVVSNRADSQGLLSPARDVFVGQWPDDMGIANTAVEWDETRWTMLIWWSLSEDRFARLSLMAHEAFHRVQPELGLTPVGELNAHLDTADGRFWQQMEWNALQRALLADGEGLREAIEDALIFRSARRNRFPEAAAREVPLEIFEGVAEYTGMRMAGYSAQQVVERVSRKREHETGFVRSFAYVTGPLYGFLLDQTSPGWRERLGPESDLGLLLADALELSGGPVGEAHDRAESYGGSALREIEAERETEREARLAAWRASLIEGPVLIVDLNAVAAGTFDPRTVFPFGERQTIYATRELIAEWGRLTVSDGAILEDENTARAHVSLAGAADDFSEGEGWTLALEPEWAVVPAERSGDFEVRKP